MNIRIGQVYKLMVRNDSPFSTPHYVKIVDIRTDRHGKEWVQYKFLHERANGMEEGIMDSDEKSDDFLHRYVLDKNLTPSESISPVEVPVKKCNSIVNAISQIFS